MTAEYPMPAKQILETFRSGTVIPAHPLALTADRALDDRRQRALTRYYLDAGAGGLAVGVHTTEFKIHDPDLGMYTPVLQLAVETARTWRTDRRPVMIAGICGRTDQAVREAVAAGDLGYHIAMISLAALADADENQLIDHARTIAEVIPIMGFYLQPAVGGRVLGERFWRKLVEIPNLVGIKIAPFDRYRTIDVVRAVAASGRADQIALYTGNDDNIVIDLLTGYEIGTDCGAVRVAIAGGLLGHWAFWTKRARELLEQVKQLRTAETIPTRMLTLAAQVTEANGAVFDAQNDFKGCISGILYVLTRAGLLEAVRTLGEHEQISAGQTDRIDRIISCYPHLTDDNFVRSHLNRWLRP